MRCFSPILPGDVEGQVGIEENVTGGIDQVLRLVPYVRYRRDFDGEVGYGCTQSDDGQRLSRDGRRWNLLDVEGLRVDGRQFLPQSIVTGHGDTVVPLRCTQDGQSWTIL